MALDYVAGNQSLLSDPVASPFHATPDLLRGLPPLLMVVSGTETLASDSILFAGKAAAAGAEVVLDIYPGMWHVFPMYSEGCGGHLGGLRQGALALTRSGDFVRQAAARGAP